MGDAAGHTGTDTTEGYRQYLDTPSFSEWETEERIRNISRHRLGKCVNLEQFISEMGPHTDGHIGNESPCEFCLHEELTKSLTYMQQFVTAWRSTGVGPGMSRLPVKSGATGNRLGSGRRPSWSKSAMGTRNGQPITRSLKFTKQELSAFLPRRTFFSCHDKALKEAGYSVDQPAKKREVRRQSNAYVEEGVSQRVDAKTKECPNQMDSLPTIVLSTCEDTHLRSAGGAIPISPDEVNVLQGKHQLSSRSKLDRKKMEDEYSRKEHKVLTDYFRYVKENQIEYQDYIKRHETASLEEKPVEMLIKTAMAYQRGHHGQARDSPVVRASHDLKPRYTDPSQWMRVNKEKNPVFNFNKKELTTCVQKSVQDGDCERQAQDEGKTELDRCRHRAEKWLRTVPANQQLKARLMALEEVGEEDLGVTQWWNSLQSCHYIRRHYMREEDM